MQLEASTDARISIPNPLESTPEMVGSTLTVTVTGSKTGYATTAKTSVATAAVAPLLTLSSTPVPRITGTVRVGSTLTAAPGTWGPAPVTLAHQWKAAGVAITGATKATYVPVAANVGKSLTVTVTGPKTGYATTAKTSVATAAVAPPAAKHVTEDITSDTTWQPSEAGVYVIDPGVSVTIGTRLTVAPGTVVKGTLTVNGPSPRPGRPSVR